MIKRFNKYYDKVLIKDHAGNTLSEDGLIEMKQELGREKDLKDIALIKAFKGQKVIDS